MLCSTCSLRPSISSSQARASPSAFAVLSKISSAEHRIPSDSCKIFVENQMFCVKYELICTTRSPQSPLQHQNKQGKRTYSNLSGRRSPSNGLALLFVEKQAQRCCFFKNCHACSRFGPAIKRVKPLVFSSSSPNFEIAGLFSVNSLDILDTKF